MCDYFNYDYNWISDDHIYGNSDGYAYGGYECVDSSSWNVADRPSRTCAYVAENAEKRCSKSDDFNVEGWTACPEACGMCTWDDGMWDEDHDEDEKDEDEDEDDEDGKGCCVGDAYSMEQGWYDEELYEKCYSLTTEEECEPDLAYCDWIADCDEGYGEDYDEGEDDEDEPAPAPTPAPGTPTAGPTTPQPTARPTRAPSRAPTAMPTAAPTSAFLVIEGVGTESTCVADVECDVRWTHRGPGCDTVVVTVVMDDGQGTVVATTTTENDGHQASVVSGDAQVSAYTMTVACSDDDAVADSHKFELSYTQAPTKEPTREPTEGPIPAPTQEPTDGPIPAPSSAPVAAPTTPRVACEDSTSWFYKKSKNTCADYVSKKSKNCKKADIFNRILAEDACPATCGTCDADGAVEVDDAACADSTSWRGTASADARRAPAATPGPRYFKKSKDTCETYVTKKSKNCKKKDEFKVRRRFEPARAGSSPP